MTLFIASLLDPLLIIAYLIVLIFKPKNSIILLMLGGIAFIHIVLNTANPYGFDEMFFSLLLMSIGGGAIVLFALKYLRVAIESMNTKDNSTGINQISPSAYSKKNNTKDK